MRVQIQANPFVAPCTDYLLTERATVISIIEKCNDMDWAKEYLHVVLNGIHIPACWWQYVTVKPEVNGNLNLCIVQKKGQVLPVLASVALIALTAGIGTFGVPFAAAGSTFAAGGFGASALAAGVGIAGQLAINALTAPPSIRKQQQERTQSSAGVSVNQLTPLELLPTLHGEIIVSPPVLFPPWTELDGDKIIVTAGFGIQGRNLVSEVKVNNNDIDTFDDIEYETTEGAPGEAPSVVPLMTVIEQADNVLLSNFDTALLYTTQDPLTDQVTPENSAPKWHPFKTKGTVDEIRIRFIEPAGIVKSDDGSAAAVPIRIQIRKVGDVTWLKLPTLHLQDVRLGAGPFRAVVTLKFQTQASGRHFSKSDEEFPFFEINAVTGIGQAHEYAAETYFQNTSYPFTDQIPTMTGATTSGVTMSASSELAGAQAAWKAGDKTAAKWQPANNSLPAWLQIQYSSAKTIRSYILLFDSIDDTVPTTSALTFYTEGSNNGTDWTLLDETTVDISDNPFPYGYYQIGSPGAYTYYRHHFLSNNGAANAQIAIKEINHFLFDAPGLATGHDTTALNGHVAAHDSTSDPRSIYGSLDRNGATFYLDPAVFLPGEYEVRIKRGDAFQMSDFVPTTYSYSGLGSSDFFEYRLNSGKYVDRVGQKKYRSDTAIEVFQSVSYDAPFDFEGVSAIVVRAKSTQINSVSALMKSYARVWSGTEWTDAEEPTSNPAALYRRLLLGHAHPNPQPPELINDEVLIDWYDRCVANGHECNYLQQGGTIADVKEVIAYTGYASPQESELLGIAEDYDRSAEPITQMLTPLNSRLLGEVFPSPDIEHGIIAEFLDEDNYYKVARPIIYRDGYSAINASVFTTIRYDGFTNLAKVTARAEFDMMQSILRAATVQIEVDLEGYTFNRNKLIGHTDDVIDEHSHYALITAINTTGPNIVSIEVNNKVPFTEMLAGLDVDLDGIDPTNPFGAAIRLNTGLSIVKVITNTTDSSTIVFQTPFASAGSGLSVSSEKPHLVSFGIVGKEYRRMIVMGSRPRGTDKRVLSLAPEANELFQ